MIFGQNDTDVGDLDSLIFGKLIGETPREGNLGITLEQDR